MSSDNLFVTNTKKLLYQCQRFNIFASILHEDIYLFITHTTKICENSKVYIKNKFIVLA